MRGFGSLLSWQNEIGQSQTCPYKGPFPQETGWTARVNGVPMRVVREALSNKTIGSKV